MIELYQGSQKRYSYLLLNYLYEDNEIKLNSEQITELVLKYIYDRKGMEPNIKKENYNVIDLKEDNVFIDNIRHKLYSCVVMISAKKDIINELQKLYSMSFRSIEMPTERCGCYYPKFLSVKLEAFLCSYNRIGFIRRGLDSPGSVYMNWYDNYSRLLDPLNECGISVYMNYADVNTKLRNDYYNNHIDDIQISIICGPNLKDSIEYAQKINKHFVNIRPYNILCPGYSNESGDKIYIDTINNTTIIYDSIIGYQSIKEQLKLSQKILKQYDIINIIQYGIINYSKNKANVVNEGLIKINSINSSQRVLLLYLVNKDRLFNIKYNNHYNYLYIDAQYNKKSPLLLITNMKSDRLKNTFIVPFAQNNNIHIKSIILLDDILKLTTPEQIYNYKNIYVHNYLLMEEMDETNNDILYRWFQSKTISYSKERDLIKERYLKLKQNLLQEYDQAKLYMDNMNLSNIKPIPSITLGKEFQHNPLKKLYIDWKSYYLQQVNNYYLGNSLECKDLVVRYNYNNHKNNKILINEIKYDKLLDKKSNNLEISVEKIKKANDMKGMV